MKYRTMLAAVALVFPGAIYGCTEEDPSDQEEQLEEAESAVRPTAEPPIGTFVREARAPGELVRLVLKTDHTFHSETLVVCFQAPCDPVAANGMYRTWVEGDQAFLRLDRAGGGDTQIYAYVLSRGDYLRLRPMGTRDRIELTRAADAWCGVPPDCPLQELAEPVCAGAWWCGANTCNFRCSAHAPPLKDRGPVLEDPFEAANPPAQE